MAILDQPFGPPPPAYSLAPSPATSGLPPGIWLQILGTIVRPSRPREEQLEGWATIHRELRLVCKDVYLGERTGESHPSSIPIAKPPPLLPFTSLHAPPSLALSAKLSGARPATL